MLRKSFPKQSGLAKTTEDYANRSTVHGLGYTFDRKLFRTDRCLWVFICLSFASLAVHLTYQSYNNWQDNQVVITLKNTAKPVNEINFPVVTICSAGLHMDLVEKVFNEKVRKWLNGSKPTTVDIAKYMAEFFQISDKEANILDILDTMVASNVEASVAANSVRENVVACSAEEPSNTGRRKRENTPERRCCSRMMISSATISKSTSYAKNTLGLYKMEPGVSSLGNTSNFRVSFQ